jgi:hypothetical protein
MNLNRIIVVLVVLVVGIFIAAKDSFAGKDKPCSPWPTCKDGGGDPPPPPPECDDTFPGFVYGRPNSRKDPGELHLASSDVCRDELLVIGGPQSAAMSMTADRSKGVLLWVENLGNTVQRIVRRMDFTVDASGNLTVEDPVTILPLAGEEALPGDQLYLLVRDVWGDATHDSLYLALLRNRQFNSGPYAGNYMEDLLIYDLNALTDISAVPPPPAPDVRTIFNELGAIGKSAETWDWPDAAGSMSLAECDSAPYPQFSPTCYEASVLTFNSSGTRLYIAGGLQGELQDSDVESWNATMRIDIDKKTVGPDLADWIIGGPEMVAAVDFRGSGGPEGLGPRPGVNRYELPDPETDPEIIAAKDIFINADLCAAEYAQYANGNTSLPDTHWELCLDTSLVGHTGFSNGQAWESSDSYLFDRLGQQGPAGRGYIYRIYVTGPNAGTEELLIENARGLDTGL